MLEQLRTRSPKSKPTSPRASDGAQRHAMIAEAAYYCAKRRGFAPGHDVEDWLHAEAEIARSPR